VLGWAPTGRHSGELERQEGVGRNMREDWMRLPASDCARAKMSSVAGAMWPPSSAWHPGGGRRLARGLRCGEKWRPSSGPHENLNSRL
jgi:hypothetical protein